MASIVTPIKADLLQTLPSDAARHVQWRLADRYDLQMLVQSARAVARGPVARLVANGGRNSHDWTPAKAELLDAFDKAGITAVFMEPEQGGFIAGPKNLALALVAFELAWVDGGAATASLAGYDQARAGCAGLDQGDGDGDPCDRHGQGVLGRAVLRLPVLARVRLVHRLWRRPYALQRMHEPPGADRPGHRRALQGQGRLYHVGVRDRPGQLPFCMEREP